MDEANLWPNGKVFGQAAIYTYSTSHHCIPQKFRFGSNWMIRGLGQYVVPIRRRHKPITDTAIDLLKTKFGVMSGYGPVIWSRSCGKSMVYGNNPATIDELLTNYPWQTSFA